MAPRGDMRELGTTGLKRTSGVVVEEFLPALRGERGARVLREMSDNDPVIGAFVYAIEKIITRIEWHFEPFRDESGDGQPTPEDVETATFVDSCLNDMSDSWDTTLAQILSMIVFGWSWHEIVYKRRGGPDQKNPAKRSKYDDSRIGWRKWSPRAQDTLWQWQFADDGGIEAMIQMDPWTGHGTVPIPIEKSLLFRTGAAKGNPEGRSLLRNAYRAWWYKKRIEEIEAIGIERDLAGLPVAWVPPEYLSSTATDDMKAALLAIQEIVTGVKRNEHEGIVFPLVYDESGNKLLDLTLLSTGGSRQFDTDKIITRWDQRIAMTVLSDFILLGHERVGSFSLGTTKMDLFTMAIDSLCKTIADTINDHAVPRLLRLNGMDLKRPPRLVYSEVANVELTEIGDFVSKMATAGVIAPDPGLEDHLRDLAGLPVSDHASEEPVDLSEDDQKAVAALPPAQRLMAERTGVVPEPGPAPGMAPQFGGGAGEKSGPGKPGQPGEE